VSAKQSHSTLAISSYLGLAGDRLDHAPEDVSDADAGADRAEPTA
jgi:hypothetical protein